MHQDELIEKLQREKKSNADGRQKMDEDIQAAEDKANHLNRVKAKLEQNLDELEDSVEREKKSRNETEKLRKKSEMDLRLTQEAILELEKNKNEINVSIQMKDKELETYAKKLQKSSKNLVDKSALNEQENVEGKRGRKPMEQKKYFRESEQKI